MNTFYFIIFAYLLGSISCGILICKLMGLPDPRSQGSGNIGATNVLRIKGGKIAAVLTLLGDALKGAIPVLAAKWYGLSDLGVSLVMLAAFLGHLFPLYYKFKGGKGVATALGCLLVLSWPAGLCLLVTWLVVALVTRYSSLAALVAAILSPIFVRYFTEDHTIVVLIIALLLIYKHKANIQRLLKGTESKIAQRPAR